jgi:hypothetical protein
MFHITSSLFGGLAAVTAWALVAPSLEQATKASLAADTHERVNRAVKADRIAAPRVNVDGTRAVVTVEVVGVHDAAIVYRDRDGRVLFQTDPLSNITVISKGFVLPQVTVRETPQSTPAPIMVPPHNIDAAPAVPVGCDPVASPIAEPALARVTGRCLS